MQALLKSLPVLLEQNDAPEMRQAIAIAMWPLAVGESLKEHSKPLRLTDRIMMVAVPDARWKKEFEHHASQIVYKLNASAGRSIIARIHCLIDPDSFKHARTSSGKNEAAKDLVDKKVIQAAVYIADPELRKNFLAAAAGSIKS